jgi:hypothetical protein
VASIASFPAVALVFADTALCADACILAALAGSLTIASLLALATSLAAGLRRQVFLISAELVLEVDRRCRGLTRL